MTKSKFGFASLLAASFLSAPGFATEEPRYAPPPAWVVGADAPLPTVSTSARDDLLIQNLEMRLTPGKRDTFFDYAVRISNAEQLEEVGTISLDWQPDRGDLVIHRIAIIRDGKLIDLVAAGQKPTVIRREERLEESSIDGTLTATLPVEGLRVGDVLRYTVTFEEVESALRGATEGSASLLTMPQRVASGTTRVIWPADLPLRWRSFGQKFTPTLGEKNGWQELTVQLPIAEQPKMPDDAPLRFRLTPQLEMSSFASWQAVSQTAAPLYATEGLISDGSALAARIDRIAKASTDPRTRAGLALQMVQDDVRYLYTGLENGNYVPQRPEDTWSLRYGDCKAKTLLLLATLRRLGITAEAALVHSEQGDTLINRLPSFGAFDHVLVRAEVNGIDLWLDGTDSGAHLEDLADVPPFSHALPVTGAGSDLIALPGRAPERPQIEMDVTLDQSAGISLPAMVTVDVRFRGAMAAQIYAARDKLDEKRKLELASRLTQDVVANVTPLSAEISRDDKSGIVQMRARGIGDLNWDRSSGRARLEIDQSLGDADLKVDRGRAAWRDLPLEAAASHVVSRTRHILPAGPDAFTLDGDPGFSGMLGTSKLTRTANFTGNMVDVTDVVTSEAIELPATEIGKARDQVAKAKTKRLILSAQRGHAAPWEEVTAAQKSKKLTLLEEAFTKAIALQADEAQPLLDRAYFYQQVFEPAKAVADFTAALDLDRTANTLVSRAWSYDSMRNADAALEDMRAARDLDPANESAISGEIYMLQHRADYAAALERVEDRLANAGEDRANWLETRGHILAESGDFKLGLADLDEANTLKPGNSTFLNGRCWLKGKANAELESALTDCTRAIELGDNAASSLDSRGLVYIRLGRWEEALADLNAALDLNPGQSGTLFLRSLALAKLGKKEQAERDLAGAKLQWPGVIDEFARFGLKP